MKTPASQRNTVCLFYLWFEIMASTLFRNKELKLKENILKGVYEDNLRIIGKISDFHRKRSSFALRKMFLLLAFMAMTCMVQGSILHFSITPDKYPSGTIPEKSSLFSDEKNDAVNPIAAADSKKSADGGSRKFFPIHSGKETVAGIVPIRLKSFLPDDAQIAGSLEKPSDFISFLDNSDIALSRMFGLGVKTIMIDAGHGGEDNGTVGKLGTREKDITLDIARRLETRLEKHERYHILMTREDDTFLPLQRRVELAQLSRADIFVSIHINYVPRKPINIIETYYFGPTYDAGTLKLAETENAGSEYNISDFREMIEKIGNTLKLQESKDLAASIQKELFTSRRRHNSQIYDYGIKRAPFVVLLGVDVPAVLTEVSCMSNREEEVKLNTEGHRENIASYIEKGILDYLNKGELSYEAKRQ